MADEDDNETDAATGEDEEYEAPDRDTWNSTTAALTKANNEAKKWRLRAQGKDEKWSVPGWQKAQQDEDPEDDETGKKPAKRQPKVNEEAIRREAEEAAMAKAKPGLVRAAAKDALRAAGLIVPDKNADGAFSRAYRLFDLDAIDVDEDGSVSGVEDQVKAVKRDYPELFAKRGASRVNAGAGSTRDDAGQKPASSASKLAAMITGG